MTKFYEQLSVVIGRSRDWIPLFLLFVVFVICFFFLVGRRSALALVLNGRGRKLQKMRALSNENLCTIMVGLSLNLAARICLKWWNLVNINFGEVYKRC